ncbi:MAG: hypothetical protein DLM69_06030 [Candidatus Chloroheliales bacterium]|nr:MAG: hypothetical protein DLM69_06030 [Chloroflexota bacterium]
MQRRKQRLFTILAMLIAFGPATLGGTAVSVEQAAKAAPIQQAGGLQWLDAHPAHRPPDNHASIVYDEALRRSVMYNGATWEYDGTDWVQKQTAQHPPETSGAPIAYDIARARVVFFGGADANSGVALNETWEYDGNNWVKMHLTTTPPPRSSYSMAYDSRRKVTVLFGGSPRDGGDPLNDTWEYNGISWVQKQTSSVPGRTLASMAYDADRGRIVLFGGWVKSVYDTNDTWEYDGRDWQQVHPAAAPPTREMPALAYDAGRHRMVLFGGLGFDASLPNNGNLNYNDTWEYNGTTWTQARTDVAPPERFRAGLIYDKVRGRLVLFGGETTNGLSVQTLNLGGGGLPVLFRVRAMTTDEPQSGGPLQATSIGVLAPPQLPLYGGELPLDDTWEYGPAPSGIQLVVTQAEVAPADKSPGPVHTLEPVRIKLTIENHGTQRVNAAMWSYNGQYNLAGDDMGPHSFTLDQDSSITPVQILLGQPESWRITINAYFTKAAHPGHLSVHIQPALGTGGLDWSQDIEVVEGSDQLAKCSTLIASTLAGGFPSGNVAKVMLNSYAGAMGAYTCKDVACQASKIGQAILKSVPGIVGGITGIITGLWRVLRNDYPGAKECYNIGPWVGEIVKRLQSGGFNLSLLGVHSPAVPLVVDAQGRRAGVLPDGTVVQEIPGSQVVVQEDGKYVLYPNVGPTTVQVHGTGTGTMTIEMVTSLGEGYGNGEDAVYHDVPVTPQLVAQVASSDPKAMLQIASQGNGQVDRTLAPSTLESLSGGSYGFAESGHVVTDRFLTTWYDDRSYEDNLYINGLPISDKHEEVSLTDGRTYKVQWFERARFEEHPENQAPNDVLLGLLGVQAVKGRTDPPFHPIPNPNNGLPWFPQTQHTLGDSSVGGQAIARFWQQLGGLAQFGYPLSQPFMETSKDDGKAYLVQYFERQRFEYHPENKGTKFEVLLGRLGAEQMGPPK